MNGLDPKEQRFVDEYFKDFNATEAVYRAGYEFKTRNGARVYASKLLDKQDIADAIKEKRDQLTQQADAESLKVIKEIARIAFNDPRKIFTDSGTVKDIQDIDDDTAAAIGGIEIVDYFEPDAEGKKRQAGYIKKFKFWDKNPALDKLMRYLDLYKDSGSDKNPLKVNLQKVIFEVRRTENGGIKRIRKND